MITLYGHPFSRAHRVMWMLKELGLPFAHVPTDFLKGGSHASDYLAINPNGRVPALTDGDLTLFESVAINLYLARCYGGPLAPASVQEDALITQWSVWAITEIEKPLLFAAANLALFPEAGRRPADLAMAMKRLARPWAVLEQAVQAGFLVASRFTTADLNVAAIMSLVPIAGVDMNTFPAARRWLDTCLERPAAADWKPIHFTVPRPADENLLAMFL